MKRYFVDSNVFLRFFIKDDEDQRVKARKLFHEAADGKIELVTGPPAFFEIAWTLRSAYHLEAGEILAKLESIQSMTGLEITDRDLVESAMRLAYETGVTYPDAYIAASATELGADGVVTFNVKDFKKAGVATYGW